MKRPRVALVEAASSSTHVYSRSYRPRVGIPTMGAVLRGLGYECDLWFQSLPGMKEQRLRRYDIVGIGSLTNTMPEAYRLADSLKGTGPVVVMGGPHVTFMAEEALEHCDYVVVGEGDASFPALVAALAKEEAPEAVPGLAYRLPGGEVRYTGPAEAVDYASLPAPDWSLSPQVRPGREPWIIMTSRGCPHHCTFCTVTAVFGRRYRFRPGDQIIAELRRFGDAIMFFADDNFCANRARTKSLLRDMIEQKAIPRRWTGQMCVEAADDEELLELLRETRCRIMHVGIESISPETLKEFDKVRDVSATGRCVENLHRHNIGVHGMFVVGAGDTPRTVRETVDYAIATDMDFIQIFPLTPFPGTRAFEELEGRLLHREWGYFDGMHVVVQPRNCSAYDLQMAVVRGMQRFYSPRRLLGAYRRGRRWRVKGRAAGIYIVRRWIRENTGYIEWLKSGC